MRVIHRIIHTFLTNLKRTPNGKRFRMSVAAVMVFVITYSLILPAIAIERQSAESIPGLELNAAAHKELNCVFNAHTHTEKCYKDVPVLDGNGNDTGQTEKVLVCGKADWVVHTHDESCYQDGFLMCGLPEIPEHLHTEACYQTEQVLACGNNEHEHTDECYKEHQVLICGEHELHTHTADCYEKGPNGESPEKMGWVWYETDADGNKTLAGKPKHLICGKLELLAHQHDDACFVYYEEPVETGEETVAEQDGEIVEDTFSEDINQIDEYYETGAGETETESDAADFYSENVVIDENEYTNENPDAVADGTSDAYTIENGDLNTDASENSNAADSSGIEANNIVEEIVTDEMAAEAAAREAALQNADETEEDADQKDKEKDKEEAEKSALDTEKTAAAFSREIEVEGAPYTIRVSGGEACGIPADAIFTAEAFTEDQTNYNVYRDRAFEAVDEKINEDEENRSHAEKMLGLFDLTIFDADGTVIEPKAPVSVTVHFGEEIKENETDGIYAVHFQGTGLQAGEKVGFEEPAGSDESVVTSEGTSENAENPSEPGVTMENTDGSGDMPENADASEKNVRISQSTAEKLVKEMLRGTIFGEKGKILRAEIEVFETADEGAEAVSFETGSLSVYAVVYTVDFHWEVDGKQYDFSIPGGGFVSFTDLMEVLGITGDTNAPENTADAAEENAAEAEKNTAEITMLTRDDVVVSEETRKFVADVEHVEFTNPELVWVGKVENDSTVGELKDVNELECRYSADLTEVQIEEINAQTVEAGDWALISVQPFDTEEMLTVTLKDGEVFVIRVTDAAYSGTLVTSLNGATGALINKQNKNAVLSIAQDSSTLRAVAVTLNGDQITTADGSPALPEWTFNYVDNWNGYDHYTIRCDAGYLNLSNRSAAISQNPQNLIVVSRQNNGELQIRIANDNHDALNNENNGTANGYKAYNNWGYDTNPGEWFTVYKLSYAEDPWNLSGKSLAIINNREGGNNWQALRDEIDGVKDPRGYYVSGNDTTYTNVDGIDYSSNRDIVWTFEFVSSDSTGSYYRIHTSNGYLYIDPNVTKKSDMPSNQSHSYEHALRLESSAGDGSPDDGTLIRVVSNGDGTYVLQNRNGVSLWNYGNDQFWLSTLTQDGESQTSIMNSRYRLTQRLESPHVTVHYVDRYGNILTGVRYTGANSDVIDNNDGTFIIPYNTSGNVDLRAQFDFTDIGDEHVEYTYANTHLDGKDASGNNLTHQGYVIDSELTASGGTLNFKTDTGETNYNWMTEDPNVVLGNLAYGSLKSYDLSGRVYARPTDNTGSKLPYVLSNNKDIYVVLDPLPANYSGGSGGVDPGTVETPTLEKTMESNDDGTYTLSLKVDAHAKNAADTNKANILFVVDTSSSMRATTTDNQHNRIMDTHDAVLDLGQRLLEYNTSHPGAVEVSMLTFDGGVNERLDWTTDKTEFQTAVNEYLRYYWLHTGTDWEDGMNVALEKLLHDTDDKPTDADPTFVVFFTDGEPSQYTNFHGAGTNGNADPTGTHTGSVDPGSGYPNFYSYFLSREASKDEMRAVVDAGAQLYGIYAYNTTQESYSGYNGAEDGAKMLHNAIKYGYNTENSLENNYFYEAKNTKALQGAFDRIFNLITEAVGFTNVTVKDGIASEVTSTTVVDGDVSAFTYTIKDKTGALAYQVKVAPNGVAEGMEVADDTPMFFFGDEGDPHVGQKKEITVTKIKTDASGAPVLDGNNKIQTEDVPVEVYYYKDTGDPDAPEYIMPICTTGTNIKWELAPLGILKDGYSYEVSFVVWPNQESYDLVADLNNGKRPDLEATADWESRPILIDKDGKEYRKGGIPSAPYISRYEESKIYAALSNTDQSIEYYKVDQKIVNGQEVTEYTGPVPFSVLPPDPMPLTASVSELEKQWNVERDPGILAQYLFNTDGTSKQFRIDFDVFQGAGTTPYLTVSLGWDPEANNGQGAYVWAPDSPITTVTYAGHQHQIGTRWSHDFSIATGLMLSTERMDELGLNKSLYPSADYDGTTYYILEEGHDYTIEEKQTGTIGYEFDFISPKYHPMLVDGVLQSVDMSLTKDGEGNIQAVSITGMTDNETGLSSLLIENTLRGYIHLSKVVVDQNNHQIPTDNTKFEYTIRLENSTDPGPFKGDHIPWYGINGLFYHDSGFNYYQVYETEDRTWKLKDEAGGVYDVTSTGFNPDLAEEQTVDYKISDEETRTVVLSGNQMTASDDGKIAETQLKINQSEILNIANVPVGTIYTITEAAADAYELSGIRKEIKDGDTVESSQNVDDFSERNISGEIVENRDNNIIFTNKVK